jgi:hypothetical protein
VAEAIFLGMVAAEVIPILLLVGIVGAYGAAGGMDHTAFAQRVGLWFGPLAGTIATFIVARAVARRSARPRVHGVLIGGAVGALDFLLVVASGAPMALLFVGSALARLAAGVAAGVLAGRAQRPEAA